MAMTSLQSQEEQKSQAEPTGRMPLLLRVTWMAFGNVGLFLCAALVAKGTAPVVMVIVTTMVTPPALKWSLGRLGPVEEERASDC